MPELTPSERLQPALLDRLTDDEPERKQEPREQRVMTKSRLRQAVLRDLAWLFNATRLEGTVDLSGLTHVRRSVINFGLPALSGRAASSMDVAALERAIRQAILDYEPRIIADTLQVTALLEPRSIDHHNVIGVEIHSQLWAQPVPLELLVRTEIDLETGKVQILKSAGNAERVMDPRLLEHYNVELQHLREMGAEFANQFPKIAARLGMNGLEVADPYVERLIESVAFLAARVQLKLNAEFPRFTQALLDIVYPHYLAPTPAMLVAQMQPDINDPNLATSKTVPRGTSMTAVMAGDDRTACDFRTAHDVVLWPIQITNASYFSFAPDLALNALPLTQSIKGGVRLRLKTGEGLKFAQLPLDHLSFYIGGGEETANRLHELCAGHTIGALVLAGKGQARRQTFVPGNCIRPAGFDDDQALLPVTLQGFQGYRLVQEYFAFPERYRFVDVGGLAGAVKQSDVDEIEIVLLFDRGQPGFESVVDQTHFSLFCTPAINLFSKRADRIHVNDKTHEYHVVADRTRPMDFEIYEVTDVVGHGGGTDSDQTFLPLYTAYVSHRDREHAAYFTVRREPRLPSSAQKRRGGRSTYIGTEVFISLVDPADAPFRSDLRQLSIRTLCTNRDLVLQMPIGLGSSDFTLDVAAPVKSIRVVSGPSRPHAPLTDGAVAWRAINHLALNYLSLVNATPYQGAAALRELLDLYVPVSNVGARKQVDGVRAMGVRPVVRRLPESHPIAFGRGLEITVTVDELAFEGASAFLLGAVLARYFTGHVSINTFTETVLRSESRGEIQRWVPMWGARPTL